MTEAATKETPSLNGHPLDTLPKATQYVLERFLRLRDEWAQADADNKKKFVILEDLHVELMAMAPKEVTDDGYQEA